MIINYPMTHLKQHRLDRQRRRMRRQHWDEMNERLNSGKPIAFPYTTTEELRIERENYRNDEH